MQGISFDNIRVGRRYRMVNFSETYEFVVEKNLGNDNFDLKDIHTLEPYRLQELIQYGRGEDFEIREFSG